jgi:hypothetical protein
MSLEAPPAVGRNPGSVAEYPDRLSSVAEHTADGCKTRRPSTGADPDSYGFESLEIGKETVNHGTGQSRDGTRPAYSGYTACSGCSVERPNTRYELPTVRQVDVVAACVDGGARDSVVLTLKRPRGVEHRSNPQLTQDFVQP